MPNPIIWDKHEIKAAIGRKGQTLKGLGLAYGVNPTLIRMTLNRSKPNTKADQAISDFLGVPLHVLWPERYDDRGHRLVKLSPLRKPRLRKAA